jgi:hypothetical protein
MRWYAPRGLTISQVRISVGTSPSGASVIADINKNGTTIFTNQDDRPTVDPGEYTAITMPAVTSLVAADYLTVDIDQVGSGSAGADLLIQLEVTPDA